MIVVCGFAVIVRKYVRGLDRRRELERAGRVTDWLDLRKRPLPLEKIVQTDFGFGKEIWAIRTGGEEIDLSLSAFQSGLLIHPRPRHRELQEFCRSHQVELVQMRVKSKRGSPSLDSHARSGT